VEGGKTGPNPHHFLALRRGKKFDPTAGKVPKGKNHRTKDRNRGGPLFVKKRGLKNGGGKKTNNHRKKIDNDLRLTLTKKIPFEEGKNLLEKEGGKTPLTGSLDDHSQREGVGEKVGFTEVKEKTRKPMGEAIERVRMG